jgi:hypothetical protein
MTVPSQFPQALDDLIPGTSGSLRDNPSLADVLNKMQLNAFDVFFNPISYGAKGDGTTDDTAAIQAATNAAQTQGGTVVFPPPSGGAYAIAGRVTKTGAVRWVGGGPGIASGGHPSCRLLCTAVGAGVDVEGGGAWGGSMEHLTIDGNHVATAPLRDGISTSVFPEAHLWNSVFVENSAQDGWYILGSQNAVYLNCRADGNTRDGFVLDGGTGGHEIIGLRLSSNGRFDINFPWAHPGGPYGTFVGSTNFWGGICDNAPAHTGKINLTNARAIAFRGMTVYGVPCTGPAVVIDSTTVFNVDFSGSVLYAATTQPCISLASGAGSLTTFMMNVTGVEFVQGQHSISMATPIPLPTVIGFESIVDFTSGQASYAGTTDPALLLRTPQGALGQSTGNASVALGSQALARLVPGTAAGNVAVGFRALEIATSGAENTAVGAQALINNTTGSFNVGIGQIAGSSVTTGNSNSFMGAGSGAGVTTGSNNVAVGSGSTLGATNSYQTALGHQTQATAPGTVAIGTDHTGLGAAATVQDDLVLGTTAHTVKIPGALQVAGVPISSSGGLAGVPAYQMIPANFNHWRKAVGNVLSGGANGKVLSIGTSVSQGGGVPPHADTQSPIAFLATLLGSRLCTTQLSGSIPMPQTATYDDRWATASGWTLPPTNGSGAGIGIGDNGYMQGAVSAAGTATFTPLSTKQVDTFDVWYLGAPNTGVFKVNVDGGADTTITTTNATNGYYKTTLTVTRATGHVLNMHTVTVNPVYVILVEAYDSTAKSLHVAQASIDGIGTTFYYSQTASTTAIKAYAPDLTLIEFGADDAIQATPPSTATFMTQLETVITACQVSGDVVLWSPPNPNPSGPATPTQIADLNGYVAAMASWAASNGVGYIDTATRLGPYSEWGTALGMVYTDGVHANAIGNADIAGGLSRGLTAVV